MKLTNTTINPQNLSSGNRGGGTFVSSNSVELSHTIPDNRQYVNTRGLSVTIPSKNTLSLRSAIAGHDGLSAYQIACNNGFVGSIDDWLSSLKGEKGEKGDKGDSPVKGVDYFTPEEQQAIIDEVVAKIPTTTVPAYTGSYKVTPKAFDDTTIECEGKVMTDNVQVSKIPYFETSNESGDTVYIGSEL